MSLLVFDRKLDAETRDELDARPPGRDDHGFGGQRPLLVSSTQPDVAGRSECTVAIRTSTPAQHLHDRLWPVEVAVLVAPRRSGERLGPQPGHERCRLSGETTRDGTPSAFWIATFARSRSSAASKWAAKR